MLAIVYTQPREAAEYARYVEDLESIGYVEAGVEELDVEDVQGVRGLKALRVKVSPRREGRAATAEPARALMSVMR